jgi:dolichol-phosphate mannosyltransferase
VSAPELSVVMPVYNEEAAVAGVLGSWLGMLDALGADYELRAYNDGSTDGTGGRLRELAAGHPRLVVLEHPNRGHGPTVLRGYREALGEWVFQVDSDDEMPPEPFGELWARRAGHDLLLGVRAGRASPPARRAVSWSARAAVSLLFGPGLADVNTPYRLMRRSCLEAMLRNIPPDTFAPNVAISGLAVRWGLRIGQFPVAHRPRRTGQVSIAKWRLWRAAGRALLDTVRIGLAAGRRPAP